MFYSLVASSSSSSPLSSVSLVHVHNVKMQCQKQTKIKSVVAAMVMEDKSVVVCGRVYSAHKLTEKQ